MSISLYICVCVHIHELRLLRAVQLSHATVILGRVHPCGSPVFPCLVPALVEVQGIDQASVATFPLLTRLGLLFKTDKKLISSSASFYIGVYKDTHLHTHLIVCSVSKSSPGFLSNKTSTDQTQNKYTEDSADDLASLLSKSGLSVLLLG